MHMQIKKKGTMHMGMNDGFSVDWGLTGRWFEMGKCWEHSPSFPFSLTCSLFGSHYHRQDAKITGVPGKCDETVGISRQKVLKPVQGDSDNFS